MMEAEYRSTPTRLHEAISDVSELRTASIIRVVITLMMDAECRSTPRLHDAISDVSEVRTASGWSST
jgi:hypothetical protein